MHFPFGRVKSNIFASYRKGGEKPKTKDEKSIERILSEKNRGFKVGIGKKQRTIEVNLPLLSLIEFFRKTDSVLSNFYRSLFKSKNGLFNLPEYGFMGSDWSCLSTLLCLFTLLFTISRSSYGRWFNIHNLP